jgi:hypothetical protein
MTLSIDISQMYGVMPLCTVAFGSGMEKFNAMILQQIGRYIIDHILHVDSCFRELMATLLKWMLVIS